MTDDESTVGTLGEGDHGVTEHRAHVREDAAAGNGLAVISLAKSYDKRTVLSDVSISVGKGEVVGLLVTNGASKTTCFYSLRGLKKSDAGDRKTGTEGKRVSVGGRSGRRGYTKK